LLAEEPQLWQFDDVSLNHLFANNFPIAILSAAVEAVDVPDFLRSAIKVLLLPSLAVRPFPLAPLTFSLPSLASIAAPAHLDVLHLRFRKCVAGRDRLIG